MDGWMERELRENGWSMYGRRTAALLLALAVGSGAPCGKSWAQTPPGQAGQPGSTPAQPGDSAATPPATPPSMPPVGGDVNNAAPAGESSKPGGFAYDPSGRRDPFKPIGLEKPLNTDNPDVPPLQRVGLTEINLIGIMWGGFGYTAMVQTPDGKGYTIRRGTKIGPNNGVVSSITENSIVVRESYRDVYGKEQVREYLKRLHTKEGSE